MILASGDRGGAIRMCLTFGALGALGGAAFETAATGFKTIKTAN